jgi:hypothetical protein
MALLLMLITTSGTLGYAGMTPTCTQQVQVGDARSGGSGVRALSVREVLAWCEANVVKAETIARYFKLDEA